MDESNCDTSSSDSHISNNEYQNIQYMLNHSKENDSIHSSNHKAQFKHSNSINNVSRKTMGSKEHSSKTEGYCEHCRRNFCNKYYLKRHKLEVHGIHTMTGKMSWKRLKSKEKYSTDNPRVSLEHSVSSFVSSVKQEVAQTTTITTKNPFHIESLHGCSNTPSIHEDMKQDRLWAGPPGSMLELKSNPNINFSQYLKPKDNLNLPCPYCYQLFNKSNLVLHHMITSHADFIQDFMKFLSFTNDSMESQRNNKLVHDHIQPNILHLLYGQFINSSNPITDRVKCDVCFKDICNKYYLKLHKQRMHSTSGMQSDFKITSICAESFCNSAPASDDDLISQCKYDSKKDIFSSIRTSMEGQEELYDKKIRVDDDIYLSNIFKMPWNSSALNESLLDERKHCSRDSADDVSRRGHLIEGGKGRNYEFAPRDVYHDNPLDLSFKGNSPDLRDHTINKVLYRPRAVEKATSGGHRRTEIKYIKRYSSYVVKKIRKCKMHQIRKSKEANKIVFEVKEFIEKAYPKNVNLDGVSKTDYIFGKKYIDLPVTELYKHKPFAFIIQPVL